MAIQVTATSEKLVEEYRKAVVLRATGAMLGTDTFAPDIKEEEQAKEKLLKHIAKMENVIKIAKAYRQVRTPLNEKE